MNQQVAQERKVENAAQLLKLSVTAIAVVALIAGAWLFMKSRSEEKNEQAFSALFDVEKMERSAESTENSGPESTPVFAELFAKWTPEQKTTYVNNINRVLQQYPHTVAASLAGLRLGRFHFLENNFDAARTAYQDVANNSTGESQSLYRAMGLEGVATCFEAQKNFDEARKTFESSLAMKDNPLKPVAYLGQARALNELGKKEEAKAAYEKLIQEFPNSSYARKARALLNLPQG
ncbi:MAG: tetratricopeptide repeat protein [Bdellovibrionales bacterium]|nr:tetratricopeptide repeat protein [Bdellovibrionales bacterium]